ARCRASPDATGPCSASSARWAWDRRQGRDPRRPGCRASSFAFQPCRSSDLVGRTAHERLALLFGIVLAQRVADELLVHEDAAQIGMAAELDAVEIPDLALHPVGAMPELDGAVERRVRAVLGLGHLRLDAQARAGLELAQVIDDLEARLAAEVVDRRQIGEEVHRQIGIVLERLERLSDVRAVDDDGVVAAVRVGRDDDGAEELLGAIQRFDRHYGITLSLPLALRSSSCSRRSRTCTKPRFSWILSCSIM